MSSDALRAVVGTGEADLDASVDAFVVLDAVVATRVRRRLTCVIDTLGLDAGRWRAAVELALAVGIERFGPVVCAHSPPPAERTGDRRSGR